MRSKSMELMEQISNYIGDYYRQHHSTPTTREIATAVGISPASGYNYLVEMDKRGMLSYENGEITDLPKITKTQTGYFSAPLVGSIRCGDPETEEAQLTWRFIIVRTAKPRIAKKKVGGKYVKYMLYPELGAMAKNNGKVQYVLDFEVTPHQLRHTYITNLIAAGVDPKTVQYLAGHENSKITMDIYAKAKYNRPEDVAPALADAFAMWNE